MASKAPTHTDADEAASRALALAELLCGARDVPSEAIGWAGAMIANELRVVRAYINGGA